MEKINLNNYEIFFLDYYEGKLNPEQTEELFRFLNENTQLKEEFNSFDNIILNSEEIFFTDKNSLIKPEVTHKNVEKFLVAELEGDLNNNEKRALDSFLQNHPEYNKDRKLISSLKAVPDSNIYYKFKSELKKSQGKVINLYRPIAVAASVILAAFFFIQVNKKDVKENIVAEVKKEEAKTNSISQADKKSDTETLNENDLKQEENIEIAEATQMNEKTERNKEKKQINRVENVNNNPPAIKQSEKRNSLNKAVDTETQVAFNKPDKIEPLIEIAQVQKSDKAPVLDAKEKIQVTEQKELPAIEQASIAQTAINTVEKIFYNNSNQENNNSASSTVVELAANGINKLTGKETISYEKKYNEEGQLKKVQISAGNFGFSRSKSR